MNKKTGLIIAGVLAVCAIVFFSCSYSRERVKKAQAIVFNEIMPSNRTGLLTENNKAADWIEIKNTSNDSINLEGFQLALVKEDASAKDGEEDAQEPKKAKKKKKAPKDNEEEGAESEKENNNIWEFPKFNIGPGECVVIFADKGKSAEAKGRTLSASFKLPKKGATVQFLSPGGDVIKELKYGHLGPDQSLALQSDSTYAPTYWQSPGFDNTREGYEKAMLKMDAQRTGSLRINELMSRATDSNQNWVELKNTGTKEIELSQYALSKKLGKKEEYFKLPARKLQPGELVSIQLAGSSRNAANPLQAPFKTGDSETIVLSKDSVFVDGICGKLSPQGGSIGRIDGKKGWFFFSTPSRDANNGAAGKRFIAQEPVFDKKPGVYAKDKQLCLRLKDKSRRVHYTLDGRVPTADSPLMGDSIVINKGTVIRAYAEGDDNNLRSNVATATYLPGADHDLAVMNISMNKADLYDYNSGIYVEGPGYSANWPHVGANYWKKWTKDAHVEFFDGKEGFSTDCGIRIFGGFSRAEPKKSFRLKFRGRYGDAELDYDIFDTGKSEGFKDIVLRSGSQDWARCMVRDEFFTSLMQENSPTMITQQYRPVALYINAEYFGLYYIREKVDKHFVARKLNVPSEGTNIIMSMGYNEEGPKQPYMDLVNFARNNDLSVPANYAHVKNQIDLQGLIDYKLGEMYSGNTDVGNIRYIRSNSDKGDKKWHFIFYDLDASWVGYKPSVEYYLSLTGGAATSNVTHHNVLINKLLANKEFRALFLQRVSHHMHHTFATQNATAKFDALTKSIDKEMKLNCQRWPQLTYDKWQQNTADFKKKFADKHKVMLGELRTYLHVTPQENKKYFGDLGY